VTATQTVAIRFNLRGTSAALIQVGNASPRVVDYSSLETLYTDIVAAMASIRLRNITRPLVWSEVSNRFSSGEVLMRMIYRLIFLMAVLTACDSPTSLERRLAQLEFTTDRTEYFAGDNLTLRLTNGSPVEVGYNLCFARLQSLVRDNWDHVPGSGRICSAIGYGLLPGDSAEGADRLPSTLSLGTYRFVISVSIEGEDRVADLSSTTFTVR
jgi:hypothetical protein